MQIKEKIITLYTFKKKMLQIITFFSFQNLNHLPERILLIKILL